MRSCDLLHRRFANPNRTKYDLKYYVSLAKELEKMGSQLLAIKDMAGLCKPAAARTLLKALKQEIGIPIHFHTHDTAGTQVASILAAAEEGLQIADAAFAPLSGGTSQVNLNTLVESLRFTSRQSDLQTDALTQIANYWLIVRQFYKPFESETLPATGDLYEHEMPGGQYTNLYHQARALGLAEQWPDICKMYAEVNRMFGDIVKVTPTSKAVGDMALFMVAGNLTPADVLDGTRALAFPASVIDLIAGRMGQPPGGFPKRVMDVILKDVKPVVGRPGESMPPADIEAARQKASQFWMLRPAMRKPLRICFNPKVFDEFSKHRQTYGDVSKLPTPNFLYGQTPGEELAVDIEPASD